jgi:F420-non-reducing hydrogenase iron-sulfur subunit
MSDFEPKIVAFVCNWCTYAGADLTGTSRMKYSPQVSIIRFPCTGRIDFMLLLNAFANGADGIIVSGCHPNDCHYSSGNFHARRRWIVFRGLLDFRAPRVLLLGLGRRGRQVGATGQRHRRANTTIGAF